MISDTHGLLRPSAVDFLRGCEHILHAGDIGGEAILEALRHIAPLTAVRGNNDSGPWAAALAGTQTIRLGGAGIHLLHDLAELAIDPVASRLRVVVSGHSHRPLVREHHGVLYLNPGSAGPRRFSLPIAAAELTVRDGTIAARVTELAAA